MSRWKCNACGGMFGMMCKAEVIDERDFHPNQCLLMGVVPNWSVDDSSTWPEDLDVEELSSCLNDLSDRLDVVEENDELIFLESEMKDHIAYLLDVYDDLNERVKYIECRGRRKKQ